MQLNKDLKKYPAYKDSGIAWIGEIPDNWIIKKIKNNFSITSGSTPDSSVPAYWNGDITWITPADYKTEDKIIFTSRKNLSSAGYDACGTTLVPPKSIIFSKRAPIGAVALAGKHLCTNQGCLACIPFKDINPLFYYYVFSVYSSVFELYGSGTTFKEISMSDFANFKIVCPPASEQQAIADYLDEKCGAIDKAIDTEKDIIEKLKEYKQSIITETVTKGLNPYAELVPSGVDWIGAVPKDWKIAQTRRIIRSHLQGYYDADGYVTSGYRLLRITDLLPNGNLSLENAPFVKETPNIKDFVLQPGDFCFARTGGAGNFGFVSEDIEPAVFASYLIRFRFSGQNNNFLRYYFLSCSFISEVNSLIHGGVNKNIHAENIKDTHVPLPPIAEQQAIADYLDEKCTKIDKAIADKEQVIEKLTEYKKSLIYECVTGKRMVINAK